MKLILSRFVSFLTLAAVLLVGSAALAETASGFLKKKQDELTVIVRQPASEQRQKKLVAAFDALLDYDRLARDSLGDNWGKLSAEEQVEFQKLLMTLVQRSYTKSINETLDYLITVTGESSGKGGLMVQTVAKHKSDARKEPVLIDYLVHQVGGGWKVFDVVTEGSSLVKNYKSQFSRVIEKKQVSGLMELLRKKVAEGE